MGLSQSELQGCEKHSGLLQSELQEPHGVYHFYLRVEVHTCVHFDSQVKVTETIKFLHAFT